MGEGGYPAGCPVLRLASAKRRAGCVLKTLRTWVPHPFPAFGKGWEHESFGPPGAPHKPLLHVWVVFLLIALPALSQQTLPAPGRHHRPRQAPEQERREHADLLHREALHHAQPSAAPPGRPTASRSPSSPTSAAATTSGWFPSNGGWPTQLTISDQRQTAPAWSPDGNWIAYASDYDGNEQWDIFVVSPKTATW